MEPITRKEKYLSAIANPGDNTTLPDPVTREEFYLEKIYETVSTGGGGGGSGSGTVSADHVVFSDGETFQQKYNQGELSGADGYTPEKGVDYWTDTDRQEIVADVLTDISGVVYISDDRPEVPSSKYIWLKEVK